MFIAQSGHDFGDFLARFDTDEIIGLVAILSTFSTVIVIIAFVTITRTITRVCTSRNQCNLANSLAQKGMSAEEIERIVRSTERGPLVQIPDLRPKSGGNYQYVQVPQSKPVVRRT